MTKLLILEGPSVPKNPTANISSAISANYLKYLDTKTDRFGNRTSIYRSIHGSTLKKKMIPDTYSTVSSSVDTALSYIGLKNSPGATNAPGAKGWSSVTWYFKDVSMSQIIPFRDMESWSVSEIADYYVLAGVFGLHEYDQAKEYVKKLKGQSTVPTPISTPETVRSNMTPNEALRRLAQARASIRASRESQSMMDPENQRMYAEWLKKMNKERQAAASIRASRESQSMMDPENQKMYAEWLKSKQQQTLAPKKSSKKIIYTVATLAAVFMLSGKRKK